MPSLLTNESNMNAAMEIDRLEHLVGDLQIECERLRIALAESQRDRDRFRHAFYDRLRDAREFEDLDIPKLQEISAGPVELLFS